MARACWLWPTATALATTAGGARSVGAGGAGRRVAFAMAAADVIELAISNRTGGRAERLVADIKLVLPNANVRVGAADARSMDLVVNCTSVGLNAGEAPPLDLATLAAAT